MPETDDELFPSSYRENPQVAEECDQEERLRKLLWKYQDQAATLTNRVTELEGQVKERDETIRRLQEENASLHRQVLCAWGVV